MHGPVIGGNPENQTKKECEAGINHMMETTKTDDAMLDKATSYVEKLMKEVDKALDPVIDGDLKAMEDDHASARLRGYIMNLLAQVIDKRMSEHRTTCAVCGEFRPCPIRTDLWTEDGEGYVCLTCVDKRLDATFDSGRVFGTLEKVEAEIRAMSRKVAALEATVEELKAPLHDANECPYCHVRFQSKLEREEHIAKHRREHHQKETR
jgi:hypothetical protein